MNKRASVSGVALQTAFFVGGAVALLFLVVPLFQDLFFRRALAVLCIGIVMFKLFK
jgi:hypothetical protein